ncbi:MAG: transketolase, partial [Pedobacter sp.]
MITESIDLKKLQGHLRLKLLSLYHRAHAGHIGCSLSCIDLIIASLVLRKGEDDAFLLSKGHAAASLYTCLNYLGELSDDELATYYQNGTTLPAHPAPNQHRGIPFATGSLGHGLPIATGMAKARKLQADRSQVFVLMSDGETNEGTTWEAAHFAVQNGLDNLIVLIDKNGLQGFGQTAHVLGDTASAQTWKAMGFETLETDGHAMEKLLAGIDQLTAVPNGKPKVLIAKTTKGKGVGYMENKLEWHYLPMTPEQYEQARSDVYE